MQELIAFIAKSIVDHPDHLDVTQATNEDGTHITVRLAVHPEDMGGIIGREGNIARSLRNIAKALALKNDQKVYIDIVEKPIS